MLHQTQCCGAPYTSTLDVLALFAPGQRPKIEVVGTDTEFWRKLEFFTAPRSVFEQQGDAHGEIDLRLVERIEEYLRPILGPWEQSKRWWHQMDYYGDGIRSLSFRKEDFQPRFVPELHGLLAGEHEAFCILCQVHETLDGNDEDKIGSLAIRAHQIMVTRSLAQVLALHV